MPSAVTDVLGRLQTQIWAPAALIIFSAGFLLFIWGLVVFLWHVEDGSGQEEGKQHMLWGIVGMFIMVSIWSIISLLSNTLGLGVGSAGGAATDASRASSIGTVNFTGPGQ